MADNALARALALYNSPPQKSVNALPLYGALSDTGGGAPSIANQLARALLNVPTAISEAFKGNSYGSADPNNAIADAARQQFWRGSVFGVPEDVKKRNYERALNVALAAPTVYHGSPHKFDAFDSSKIGTGEGAQAFGHGLYFAENPAVAKEYTKVGMIGNQLDSLSPAAKKFVNEQMVFGTPSPDIARMAQSSKAQAMAWDAADSAKGIKPTRQNYSSAMDEVIAHLSKNEVKPIPGNLYTVDLPDAMAAKMLDWDKPLSQQHPDVQKALKEIIDAGELDKGKTANRFGILNKQNIGEHMDALIHSVGGQDRLSIQLRSLGVPGIRYLDQGSRGVGAGTSNYVVFPQNEHLLKILERK